MSIVSKLPQWLYDAGVSAQQHELPAWLSNKRQQHWDALLTAGLPTQKNERWKYADLSLLNQATFVPASKPTVATVRDIINTRGLARDNMLMIVVANGYFFPELSDGQHLPAGVTLCGIRELHEAPSGLPSAAPHTKVHAHTHAIASLNAATMTDGVFLHIPEDCHLAQPIHLLSLACGEDHFIASPYHCLVMGERSQATVLEEHVGVDTQAYMITQAMHIQLAKSARLTHVKWQRDSERAWHFASSDVCQQQDSELIATSLSDGAQFGRDEVTVTLQDRGAHCDMGGLYRLSADRQYIDHHLAVVHAAPHTQSHMLYKGILAGRSRAVFNGRVHVLHDAQKISARQANHHLLLSDTAEVYAKPELEIHADDVQCQHGATTGQLDQEAIFYLRARGISAEAAEQLLLDGFAAEVLQRTSALGIQPLTTQE